MAENLCQMTTGQTVGGAAARGPLPGNVAGRFEPDALCPPYEGRTGMHSKAHPS